MTERRVSSEKCANCPNRSRIAKLLARATRQNELAEGCEGSVKVQHGLIVTQVRNGSEPSPPKKTWNSLSESMDGERRYTRNEWTAEMICGREPIEPREGEVPYGLRGEYLQTLDNGRRVAAFIQGDEEDLRSHYGTLGIMELMDATIEMEDAEDAEDAEAAEKAVEKIRQYGFDKPISAGRRGSGNNKSK